MAYLNFQDHLFLQFNSKLVGKKRNESMSDVLSLLFYTFPHDISSRETLLGQLQVYLKTIKDDFNIRITDTGPPTGKNLPEVVNNIVWVRQLEAKVKQQFKSICFRISIWLECLFYKRFSHGVTANLTQRISLANTVTNIHGRSCSRRFGGQTCGGLVLCRCFPHNILDCVPNSMFMSSKAQLPRYFPGPICPTYRGVSTENVF